MFTASSLSLSILVFSACTAIVATVAFSFTVTEVSAACSLTTTLLTLPLTSTLAEELSSTLATSAVWATVMFMSAVSSLAASVTITACTLPETLTLAEALSSIAVTVALSATSILSSALSSLAVSATFTEDTVPATFTSAAACSSMLSTAAFSFTVILSSALSCLTLSSTLTDETLPATFISAAACTATAEITASPVTVTLAPLACLPTVSVPTSAPLPATRLPSPSSVMSVTEEYSICTLELDFTVHLPLTRALLKRMVSLAASRLYSTLSSMVAESKVMSPLGTDMFSSPLVIVPFLKVTTPALPSDMSSDIPPRSSVCPPRSNEHMYPSFTPSVPPVYSASAFVIV